MPAMPLSFANSDPETSLDGPNERINVYRKPAKQTDFVISEGLGDVSGTGLNSFTQSSSFQIDLNDPRYKQTVKKIIEKEACSKVCNQGEFPLEFKSGLDCKGIELN